jgi:vacuolar protein sorting-associated protein 54
MRRDMNYLKTKLGRIEGFADTDDFLQEIISGKDVKSDEPPATTSEATGDAEDDKAKVGELKSEAASSDKPLDKKEEDKAKAKDEEKDKKEEKKGT